MTTLFKRTATLIVGNTKTTGKKYSGLRISFEIDKTSESTPNQAKVAIYNLSAASRGELEGKGLVMQLEAGYIGLEGEPLTAVIFTGDIRRPQTVRRGPDLVTTLEAGDEEVKLRTATVDQSFAGGTPIASIFSSLASKLGVGLGTITPGITGIFQNGFVASGLVSENLTTLTKKFGLEWSVTDGQLNVLNPKLPTPDSAVLLTAQTGLIGKPCKRNDGDEKNNSFTGVEFASLLNPGIFPGRQVSIMSEEISGFFRVRRARYSGDTHEGDFRVDCEGVQ